MFTKVPFSLKKTPAIYGAKKLNTDLAAKEDGFLQKAWAYHFSAYGLYFQSSLFVQPQKLLRKTLF